MSKPGGRRNEENRGNGFHPEATMEMIEEHFDEQPVARPRVEVEPLSPQELCEAVRTALREEGLVKKVSFESDEHGRSGVVIWNVNRALELQITTALSQQMTFQVGSYVERTNDPDTGKASDKELGLVIFVFSIKGHGRVR